MSWTALLGAGISAVSSLFGGDDEETTTTIDYKKMARAAEKAGFNPLTAIRNGGSAGFTTTHHPALSMGTRIGQAFGTIGNALMAFDPRADERAALEHSLLRAQIGAANRQNAWANSVLFPDAPSAAGATRVGPSGVPEPDGSEKRPWPSLERYRNPVTGEVFWGPPGGSLGSPDEALSEAAWKAVQDIGWRDDPRKVRTIQDVIDGVKPVPNPKVSGNPPVLPPTMPGLSDVYEWWVPDEGKYVPAGKHPGLGNRGW